mmetsp:Transcript_92711/g.265804  ORF Transcript_92711/g.265804 Transcript_92711/m.265804 type:complete len:125 (+) Transcript_92711:405-779(+)
MSPPHSKWAVMFPRSKVRPSAVTTGSIMISALIGHLKHEGTGGTGCNSALGIAAAPNTDDALLSDRGAEDLALSGGRPRERAEASNMPCWKVQSGLLAVVLKDESLGTSLSLAFPLLACWRLTS